MDIKTEIKEEEPFSDNVMSQYESEFFIVKTNSDAMFLDNACEVTIKTEIKSEKHFADFFPQIEGQYFAKDLVKQKCEKVTCSNNCKRDTRTQIGSQNERDFFAEDPVRKVKKNNSDCEMVNNIEIKEEPWWLESHTSFVCNDIKDSDFTPVKSQRLCTEAASADSYDSPVPPDDDSGKNKDMNFGKNCPENENEESDITNISHVGKQVISEQSGKCNIAAEIYTKALLTHKGERSYTCEICEKKFSQFSYLKKHHLIHEGRKPHQCELCDKRFMRFSHLKSHHLIHEGRKPHRCELCEKRFTQLSQLKRHHLIHEGRKPHKCEICEKTFTHLSSLRSHLLIHDETLSHKYKICGKTFTHLCHLKLHHLTHEGKKPHKCAICDRSFSQLSHLKSHNLIHEGKKPHKCEVCEKSFTQLSHLKTHHLIHEGKKPHKCAVCEKSFTQLSSLKSHNLIHEVKSFANLKILRRDILIGAIAMT